jgi:hypothetical protein
LARINVEDSLYKDSRFLKLAMKLGDVDTALGALIRAWTLAQKWHLKPSKTIPVTEWAKQGIREEIIEVGLAEVTEEGVRVCGASKQFKWLEQRSEAGRKGGTAKWAGKPQAKRPMSVAKQPSSGARRNLADAVGSKPLSSFSFSFSEKKDLDQEIQAEEQHSLILEDPGGAVRDKVATPAREEPKLTKFVKAYCEAYKAKYPGTTRPACLDDKKTFGQMQNFLKNRSVEKACDLIHVYLQMNDRWFEEKGHDFGTFLSNVTKIQAALETGRQKPNQKTWQEIYEERKKNAPTHIR